MKPLPGEAERRLDQEEKSWGVEGLQSGTWAELARENIRLCVSERISSAADPVRM